MAWRVFNIFKEDQLGNFELEKEDWAVSKHTRVSAQVICFPDNQEDASGLRLRRPPAIALRGNGHLRAEIRVQILKC